MQLDKIKNLSILELNKLQEFAQGMVLIYIERKEHDDLKRWLIKLDTINEIIQSKLKFVNN